MTFLARYVAPILSKAPCLLNVRWQNPASCTKLTRNHDLSIFAFMHDFWTITHCNMMYTIILQNSRNIMVVNKRGIQTFKVVIVVFLLLLLCFHVFWPHKHTSLINFGQEVSPNIFKMSVKCPFELMWNYWYTWLTMCNYANCDLSNVWRRTHVCL